MKMNRQEFVGPKSDKLLNGENNDDATKQSIFHFVVVINSFVPGSVGTKLSDEADTPARADTRGRRAGHRRAPGGGEALRIIIEYARQANPPLQYASGGNGSQHHLTMERLKARAGVNMLHVPYKGGTPATVATLQGEVSAMMSGTSTAVQIRAGKLRAIAYTGPKRSAILPDVPAVAEYYPDFEMTQWYGLFAPSRTPEAVLARLRVEVARALRAPDVIDKLRASGGVEAWITTPEEFVAAIRAEYAKNGKLVRETGVKLD